MATGTSGAALFSRYAFPPNELGHCGPPGAEVLLSAGARRAVTAGSQADSQADSEAELRARAACFNGAWPYLELMAGQLHAGDPLAAEVVSAYWTGGPELDQVPETAFAEMVAAAFGDQPGVRSRLAAAPELVRTGPGHAFHVFVVYPWAGLLHAGGRNSEVARSILDQCMVRWGTVEWVDGERIGVRSPPLSWDGARLGLGPEQLEVRRWAKGGHAFVDDPRPGDQVSLHWDWACDRLTGDTGAELVNRTVRQLDSVNGWLAQQ